MGNLAAVQRATFCNVGERRAGLGRVARHAAGQREQQPAAAAADALASRKASHVPQRSLRADVRMLEKRCGKQAFLQGNTPLLAEEESRLFTDVNLEDEEE